MRLSAFWSLADEVFGDTYSRTLSRELVLDATNLTVADSLEAGVDPASVWHAWSEQMRVPVEQRAGRDARAIVPRGRRR